VTLKLQELQALADVASDAARAAGGFIHASRPQNIEHKSTGSSRASQVVTEVDRAAESRILEVLAPTFERHDLALLTEEQEDDRSRHEKAYFWCIDPLDGTLAYVEDAEGYAVSIGLVSREGVPALGVVYIPTTGVLYRSIQGGGAFRDDDELRIPDTPGSHMTYFADRDFDAHPRRDDILAALDAVVRERELDGYDIREGAGAVASACGVLDNAPACFFKVPKPQPGGGSLWDFSASACIAREAGAVVTDFSGAPLKLNRSDGTFMNAEGALYASDEHIAHILMRSFLGS
jgi:3'(2'), 5'-bisphosphate nucleotidase/myo-inositol-1(or 4)-monophosphatase